MWTACACSIWLNYCFTLLCCSGVKCGLLCNNYDRPFPELSTHCTQSTRVLDVTLMYLSFMIFFSLGRVCVGGLGSSAAEG